MTATRVFRRERGEPPAAECLNKTRPRSKPTDLAAITAIIIIIFPKVFVYGSATAPSLILHNYYINIE